MHHFFLPRLPASLSVLQRAALLHRHALGQVPRLVHVRPAQHVDVVRQQLQRHARQDRRTHSRRSGSTSPITAQLPSPAPAIELRPKFRHQAQQRGLRETPDSG
jgi:hypothetical protein